MDAIITEIAATPRRFGMRILVKLWFIFLDMWDLRADNGHARDCDCDRTDQITFYRQQQPEDRRVPIVEAHVELWITVNYDTAFFLN
jgi:hypothetical protein